MGGRESRMVKQPTHSSRIWKIIPGYAIAVLCFAWVFHDIRFKELIGSVAAISWWWVAGAVVLDTLSYVCQGIRWRLLLHPAGTAPHDARALGANHHLAGSAFLVERLADGGTFATRDAVVGGERGFTRGALLDLVA